MSLSFGKALHVLHFFALRRGKVLTAITANLEKRSELKCDLNIRIKYLSSIMYVTLGQINICYSQLNLAN